MRPEAKVDNLRSGGRTVTQTCCYADSGRPMELASRIPKISKALWYDYARR